jgi:L-cysteine:1D-myo-inositol 2-amino-2-deoxy-alpha-D-glucopyranoside ligase
MDATSVLSALRAALADDLDSPTALAELDRWADEESLDGALIADAADGLLGIPLH